jgi:hypothetical protein
MHAAFRFGQPAVIVRRQSPAVPPADALYRRVGAADGSSAITGFLRLRTRAAGATGREVPEGDIVFEAVLATEAPCVRPGEFSGDYDEVLPMSACDLSRFEAAGMLPMLWDHNRHDIPLGLWKDLRVDGDKLTGTGVLTRTTGVVQAEDGPPQPVEAIREAVASRSLRAVSVGYRVESGKRVAPGGTYGAFTADPRRGMLVAEKWTPFEASLVALPADPDAMLRKAEAIPTEMQTRSLRSDRRASAASAASAALARAWLGSAAHAGR